MQIYDRFIFVPVCGTLLVYESNTDAVLYAVYLFAIASIHTGIGCKLEKKMQYEIRRCKSLGSRVEVINGNNYGIP